MGFLPPLGLECIASTIEPFTRSIDVVDLRKETRHTTDFIRPDTDLVCFSVNWELETDFIRKEIASVPEGIFILVGGRHASEDPEKWLTECPNIDALIRGDGEEMVEELCRGEALETIDGLSFRRNGAIVHNPARSLGAVSDEIFPNRKRRKYEYHVTMENIDTGMPIDLLAGSRGCPFNCTFCSFNRNPWGQKRKWSTRSPESVVDELAQIKARIVGFTDDLFTHDPDRVERICDLILERGLRKHYFVNARLEIARRPDVLRKMEKAGFFMLMLGIESAHDKTLRSMRKGFNTKKIREYFSELKRSSMVLHGYFILGNIGETVEEMEDMIPFAHELGLDTLALTALRYSPYTGLDDLVASSPGYHIADNGKIYSDDISLDQLQILRRRLYREYYTKGQIWKVVSKFIKAGALREVGPVIEPDFRTP